MSVIRKFHPEVRLKKLLAEPGGITVGVALERAGQNLETIKDECLRSIGDKVEQIHALSQVGDEPAFAACYRLSNEIFAEAGAFDLADLSEAAHSLCSLLSLPERSARTRAAIALHVDAMRLLRAPETAGHPALRKAVMEQLRTLTAKVANRQA